MTLRRWLPSFTLTVMSGTTLFAQGVNGPIVTIRTAGQPDRKVMILKVERLPDGMVLTDVRDMATGLVYSITDTKPPSGTEGESIPVPAPAAQSRAYPALPTPPAVAPPGNSMSLLPSMPPVNPSNGAPQAAQAQLPGAAAFNTQFPSSTRATTMAAPQGQPQMGQPGQYAQQQGQQGPFGQPQMGQGNVPARAPSAFASPYPSNTQPSQAGFGQSFAAQQQGQQPQQQRTAFASSYQAPTGRPLPVPNAPANSDAQLPSARNRPNDPLLVNGTQRLANNNAIKAPTTPAQEKPQSLWDRMFGSKQETVASMPPTGQNNGPAITTNPVPRNNSTVTTASYLTPNSSNNRGNQASSTSSGRPVVTTPVALASKPTSAASNEPKLPEPKPVEGSLSKIEIAQAETHAETVQPVISPKLPESHGIAEPTLAQAPTPSGSRLPSPGSVPQLPGSTLPGSMPIIPEARLVTEPSHEKTHVAAVPTTPIATPSASPMSVEKVSPISPAPTQAILAPVTTVSAPVISTPPATMTVAAPTNTVAHTPVDTGKASGEIKMPASVLQPEPVPLHGSTPTSATSSTSAKVAADLSPEEQMKRDLSEPVHELLTHIRPSYRMEMATTIADSRYGWREEVKQVLHRVAITDPAPIVRGHCINLLTKLGYEDPAYVDLLKKWSADNEPAVSHAASNALSRLKSR